MSDSDLEVIRVARYREALAWLQSEKKRGRWESALDGCVRCFIVTDDGSPEPGGLPGTEAERQRALAEAVEELQNS